MSLVQDSVKGGSAGLVPADPNTTAASHTEAGNGNLMNGGEVGARVPGSEMRSTRMNDLPDEILHITQGFVPLSLLLSRLAQVTHNSLQEKITELSRMPLPATSAPDDASSENLRKKAALLHFAQDMHAKWVKALVITAWSRKAHQVSKLIDLKAFIDQQRFEYDSALDKLVHVKRNLGMARMPSPDLKTALHVLSTGQAPWMPDLHYIEPPALKVDEQLKWMRDINTLLSLRLNLEDFDSIPAAFKDYSIESGRVTFKVAREFEVDLTIGDEDVEKQYWFIDFRFAFEPTAANLTPRMRSYLEACVNDALAKDGLTGCYQFLHEFTLTYKVNELKRQALQLSKTSWTGTLAVEPLNRALALQYWTSRSQGDRAKSWVLIAVESGDVHSAEGKNSSRLVAKWYRDGKEVKHKPVPFDDEHISADALLRSVVGMHIENILSSIHERLASATRFKNDEAKLSLQRPENDLTASSLTMQIGFRKETSLLIEPTTGVFAVKPHSKFTLHPEHLLNASKGSAEDGVSCLESIRCSFLEDEINRNGSYMGWATRKAPLSKEAMRSITKMRDGTRTIWLSREGWEERWSIGIFLSLNGDEWWLVDAPKDDTARSSKLQVKLPLNRGQANLSDEFWYNLTLFATGMIAQALDLAELHRDDIKYRVAETKTWSLAEKIQLPALEIALSAMFPAMVAKAQNQGQSHERRVSRGNLSSATTGPDLLSPSKQPWASDLVTVWFKGLQGLSSVSNREQTEDQSTNKLITISDARIRISQPHRFAHLQPMSDRDVTFVPEKGEFILRLRHALGEPMLPALRTRIKAVDRFVNFLEAMETAKGSVASESVALAAVVCSYEDFQLVKDSDSTARRWQLVLDLSSRNIRVKLEPEDPHTWLVDLMERMVNCDGGIARLVSWLPYSTPLARVLQDIGLRWKDPQLRDRGSFQLYAKTIDWIGISYKLQSTDKVSQTVVFDLRAKNRRGETWWHLRRAGKNMPIAAKLSAVIESAWSTGGKGWIGFGSSAVSRPEEGIVNMLFALDEAIRGAIDSLATAKGNDAAYGKGQQDSSEVVVLD